MTNRSKIDIIVQVLTAAIGGETRTRIMYKSYLSHGQARGYLDMLLHDGLIERPRLNRYYTTEKGMQFIETYEHLGEFLVPEIIAK